MGVLTVLSIHPTCWAIGAYIMYVLLYSWRPHQPSDNVPCGLFSLIGICTAVMEAPFLSRLHDYAEKLTSMTSGLQYWHKGVIYFLYVLVFGLSWK